LERGSRRSKKTKKAGKNIEKNAENNGNETSKLFKERSIFWNLPYWKDLMVRHAIDVMHVEKNMCEALVGILLDIPGKTKDTLNAQMSLCNCLHEIKVPTSYSDNMSGMVNMKTLKVHFKKSHDCHLLIGQFLPIAIRGILPAKVRDTIMKLCLFFNAISQNFVDPMKFTKLQDDLILTMCNIETIFPPLFFDLMPHSLIHIVHEMKYLCPMFLHQLYPFERFMTVLKKYVHNQSRLEGCMV
jgi:hypothetical protein